MNVLFQFGEIDHHNAFILEFMIHSFFSPCLTCPNPKVWFSLKLKTAQGRHFLWSHDLALLPHIHTFFFPNTRSNFIQTTPHRAIRMASDIPSRAAISTHIINSIQHLLRKSIYTRLKTKNKPCWVL